MKKVNLSSVFLAVLLTVTAVAPAATLADSNDLNTIYLLQAQVSSLQQIVATLLAVKIGDLGNNPAEPPGQAKKTTTTPTPTPVSAAVQSQPTPTPTPAAPEAQAERKAALEKIQTNLQSVQTSLTAAQNTIQAQESVSGAGLNLTRILQRGSSGNDVRQLQGFLKNFPDIYPEGLVTGNFGSLTEKAVIKFQQKNGIDAVGFIGPRTRAELNKQATASDCSKTLERPCYDKVLGGTTTKLEKANGENAFVACMNNSSNSFRSAGQLQTLSCTEEEFFYCNEGQSGNQLRQFFGTCVAPTPTPTPTPTITSCAPITVSISSSTPPAQNVVLGQSNVSLVIFNIVANCNLNLNSFAVSLLPMPNGYQNISSLRLYNNATGTLLGSTTASVAGLNFTNVNQPILANQVLSLKVVGDISPSAVLWSMVYGVFGGSSSSDTNGTTVGNNASGNLISGQPVTIQ